MGEINNFFKLLLWHQREGTARECRAWENGFREALDAMGAGQGTLLAIGAMELGE